MICKASASGCGLNDIAVCVTLYTELTALSIFLCQPVCLLGNARFNAFKRFYVEVKFYCILKTII
jgi:hypothetical protein